MTNEIGPDSGPHDGITRSAGDLLSLLCPEFLAERLNSHMVFNLAYNTEDEYDRLLIVCLMRRSLWKEKPTE